MGSAVRRRVTRVVAAIAVSLLAAVGCAAPGTGHQPAAGMAQARAAASNPDLDPGASLGGIRAPRFRLVNQFGQPMALAQFHGKVVILAFTDSQCTTVCPLTTVSLFQARELLGPAGQQVQLLAVNANPRATSVADVLAYSKAHNMVNQWDFLTGTPAQLAAVWKAYHIYARIQAGQVDHTPAVYVIDQRGREQKLYLTTMAYASVGQAAQILASEAASLLPGHLRLASQRSLAYIAGTSPATKTALPGAAGGTVRLGPGHSRLVVFFATWLAETSDLNARLTALNRYAVAAGQEQLPQLTAIDEAVTEPTPTAARTFLGELKRPLRYPVGLDLTGRVADGYGVQDQPWFVLTSATGKIMWKHDGWLPVTALETAARRA